MSSLLRLFVLSFYLLSSKPVPKQTAAKVDFLLLLFLFLKNNTENFRCNKGDTLKVIYDDENDNGGKEDVDEKGD